MRVVDAVEEVLKPYTNTQGIEIVDVEFVKEGPYRYLRVTIDMEDRPVSLDECELVSKFLSNALDEKDPIEEQYFLEVTSPGVERILKREKEYTKYAGHKVRVSLFQPHEGQKTLEAILVGLEQEVLKLEIDGRGLEIPMSKVSQVKLRYDFE